MTHRVPILWSRFDRDLIAVLRGERMPPFDQMTYVVDEFSEPRHGAFRIAIHRPDGTSSQWHALKGAVNLFARPPRDCYTVKSVPEDITPSGSTLEIIGELDPRAVLGLPTS